MYDLVLEKIEPIEEAFVRLRNALLDAADGQNILIYKDAEMRLIDFYPEELNLSSLYVLDDHLKSLDNLRKRLMSRYQIDIFKQSDILHLRTPNGELVGMAPPFVEIYEEKVQIIPKDGDRLPPGESFIKIPLLKDGIHRAWLARNAGVRLRCVLVSGALVEYLPYAYPNRWDEVRVFDKKPEASKYKRRKNHHTFLRPIRALRQTGTTLPPVEWGR